MLSLVGMFVFDSVQSATGSPEDVSSVSKPSLIDPTKTVTSVDYVISLVVHGQHAIILLEEMNDNGEFFIYKIHFLPDNGDGGYCANYYYACYGADLRQLMFNKKIDGKVEETRRPFDASDYSTASDTAYTTRRRQLFHSLKLNEFVGLSWCVQRVDLQEFFRVIKHEKCSSANAPRFNIKGSICSRSYYHNCCTWALDRLALIDRLDMSAVKQQFLKNTLGVYRLELPLLPAPALSGRARLPR